jgi:hypothetical protein
MSSAEAQPGIPPDVMADGNLIVECIMAGRPVPSAVIRRVEQRANAITERLRQEFGVVDVGGPAIRELRGELPIL